MLRPRSRASQQAQQRNAARSSCHRARHPDANAKSKGEFIRSRVRADHRSGLDETRRHHHLRLHQQHPRRGTHLRGGPRAASGSQGDTYGRRITGSSSLENVYISEDRPVRGRFQPRFEHPGPSPLAPERGPRTRHRRTSVEAPAPPPEPSQYIGELQQVMSEIAANRPTARSSPVALGAIEPGDLAAIIALGEALRGRGATALAAHAYGSIMTCTRIAPSYARPASAWIAFAGARTVASRRLRRAIKERPDHASTYRLLAYALYRDGRGEERSTSARRRTTRRVRASRASSRMTRADTAGDAPDGRTDAELRISCRGRPTTTTSISMSSTAEAATLVPARQMPSGVSSATTSRRLRPRDLRGR